MTYNSQKHRDWMLLGTFMQRQSKPALTQAPSTVTAN
jgi:hypothetical protein